MFTATKFNKGEGNKFSYRLPEGAPYSKISTALNKTLIVRGLYISDKGNYGDTPILITDGEAFYLPKHLIETVKNMTADAECVEAINDGKVGATVYEYESKNGKGFSVRWIDL